MNVAEGYWEIDMLLKMASNIKISKALQGYKDIWFEEGIETEDEEETTKYDIEPEPD